MIRVLLILAVGIALCLFAAKKLFVTKETRILKQLFYGLAIAQAVMLLWILFLAVILGNSL